MARLYRVVRLNDRSDTTAYTFLLPKTLLTDMTTHITSKDFTYGSHKWQVSFPRGDNKQMGSFLTLRNMSPGMIVTLDFSFTIQNKEHFTKNEIYAEQGVRFSHDKPINGRKNFIGLNELPIRGFNLDNGEYLIDVELRNPKTSFEQMINLPPEHSKATQIGGQMRHQKIETNYFTFGNFDWNVGVFPMGDSPQTDGRPMIYLVRQTSFDHLCRVRFKVILGHNERSLESEVIEQVLSSGHGAPYEVGYSLYQLASNKTQLWIKVELISVSAMSEVKLLPLDRVKNKAHFYDRDKQQWMIETDTSLPQLHFRLYYTDVRNVPRNHMRHIGSNLSVVPARGHYKAMQAVGGPFSNYYAQVDVDADGYDMKTEVSVKEIQNPASAILDENGLITAHVEWLECHLLYNDKYNRFDEINSRHKYQMAREIKQLQTENYSLEKQLYSYQMSIAKVNSKAIIKLDGPSADASVHAQAQAIAQADRAQPGVVSHKTQQLLAQAGTPSGVGPMAPGQAGMPGVAPPQIVQPPGQHQNYEAGSSGSSASDRKRRDRIDRQPSADNRRLRERSRERSSSHKRSSSSRDPSGGGYPYEDRDGYLGTEPNNGGHGEVREGSRSGKHGSRYGSDKHLDRHPNDNKLIERNVEKYSGGDSRYSKSSSYAASDPGYNYDDQYSGDYQYFADKYGSEKYPNDKYAAETNGGKYADDKYYGGNGSAYSDRYYDQYGDGYSPEKYPADEYAESSRDYPAVTQPSPDKYAADDPYYNSQYPDDTASYKSDRDRYSDTPAYTPRKSSSAAEYAYNKTRGGHKEQYSDDGYYSSQTDFSTKSAQLAAAAAAAAATGDPYAPKVAGDPYAKSSGAAYDEKYPADKYDKYDKHAVTDRPSSRKHSSRPGRTSPYQEAYPEDVPYSAPSASIPKREHSHKSRSRAREPGSSSHGSSSGDKYYR